MKRVTRKTKKSPDDEGPEGDQGGGKGKEIVLVKGKVHLIGIQVEEITKHDEDEAEDDEGRAGEHGALLLLMVRFLPNQGESPVDLFQKDHPRHPVGQGQGREGETEIRFFLQGFIQPIGPAQG